MVYSLNLNMYHEQEREDVPKAAPDVQKPVVPDAGLDGGAGALPEISSGRGIKAVKMAVFGAVFALIGFCAGLGVNVREVVKDYIKEADGDWRVVALLKVMADIDKQCRESNERTGRILEKIEEAEK